MVYLLLITCCKNDAKQRFVIDMVMIDNERDNEE